MLRLCAVQGVVSVRSAKLPPVLKSKAPQNTKKKFANYKLNLIYLQFLNFNMRNIFNAKAIFRVNIKQFRSLIQLEITTTTIIIDNA